MPPDRVVRATCPRCHRTRDVISMRPVGGRSFCADTCADIEEKRVREMDALADALGRSAVPPPPEPEPLHGGQRCDRPSCASFGKYHLLTDLPVHDPALAWRIRRNGSTVEEDDFALGMRSERARVLYQLRRLRVVGATGPAPDALAAAIRVVRG